MEKLNREGLTCIIGGPITRVFFFSYRTDFVVVVNKNLPAIQSEANWNLFLSIFSFFFFPKQDCTSNSIASKSQDRACVGKKII